MGQLRLGLWVKDAVSAEEAGCSPRLNPHGLASLHASELGARAVCSAHVASSLSFAGHSCLKPGH